MFKAPLSILILTSALIPTLFTAQALAETSANVTLVSDYSFRGISQTQDEPALQVGFDYSHDHGFYLGVWGSNVDFGSDSRLEIDFFLGFAQDYDNGFGWDVGLIHYDYPEESMLNFEEIYFGLSYHSFQAKYSYSEDFAGTGTSARYFELQFQWDLPKSWGLGFHLGQSEFSGESITDYIDYRFSIAKALPWLTVELAWAGTDDDALEELGEGRLVLSLSKAL